MAGCFYYLSCNVEPYTRVCVEVRAAFSSADEIHSGQDLSSCVYLRACIDEALRMSPPVGGALWREVCKGGLKIHEQIIPEGCDVGAGIYSIHHNSIYYPSPFTYVPDRWITSAQNAQESVDLARSAFSAFSMGLTGCVGKNLVSLELMVIMAQVIWSLDIKVVGDAKGKACKEQSTVPYRDHFLNEYLLKYRFTSWKDGPMLSFRVREM